MLLAITHNQVSIVQYLLEDFQANLSVILANNGHQESCLRGIVDSGFITNPIIKTLITQTLCAAQIQLDNINKQQTEISIILDFTETSSNCSSDPVRTVTPTLPNCVPSSKIIDYDFKSTIPTIAEPKEEDVNMKKPTLAKKSQPKRNIPTVQLLAASESKLTSPKSFHTQSEAKSIVTTKSPVVQSICKSATVVDLTLDGDDPDINLPSSTTSTTPMEQLTVKSRSSTDGKLKRLKRVSKFVYRINCMFSAKCLILFIATISR